MVLSFFFSFQNIDFLILLKSGEQTFSALHSADKFSIERQILWFNEIKIFVFQERGSDLGASLETSASDFLTDVKPKKSEYRLHTENSPSEISCERSLTFPAFFIRIPKI